MRRDGTPHTPRHTPSPTADPFEISVALEHILTDAIVRFRADRGAREYAWSVAREDEN